MKNGFIGVVAIGTCAAAHAQTFTGVGILPGYASSRAAELSADGTTVVGNTNVSGQVSARAWRWRAATGLEDFGIANAGARGVSADGNAVVGQSFGISTYYWRAGQPITSVPLPGSNLQPGPGVSGDGNTVIGNWTTNGYRAATWTPTGGVTLLPYPPSTQDVIVPNGGLSVAFAVNQNASVIAGGVEFRYATDPIFAQRVGIARWTGTGCQILTDASGTLVEGNAYDMSFDGNTLLILTSVTGFHRWTPAGGFQPISGLVYGAEDAVPRISGDGSTIISSDKMWTQARGALPITQVLTEAGATYTGWSNLVVTGIDFNATHLCGYGTNPAGQTEAWYATIPTPGVCVLTALTGVVCCRRRRS